MRFIPSVLMTNDAICKIRDGVLQLQCGQWLHFDEGFKSRFIGLSKAGVIWAIHSQPNKPLNMSKFRFVNSRFKECQSPGSQVGCKT